MSNGLSDNVALVMGGGSGIGRAAAEEGMKVGVLEISPEKIEELEELGSDIKSIQGNATDLEDNERAVSETLDTFGQLDVLMCCVGLWDNQAKMNRISKEKIDEAFDETFAVNVKSYVFATRVCAEELIESEGLSFTPCRTRRSTRTGEVRFTWPRSSPPGASLYLTNKEQSRSVTGVVINSDGGLGARGLTKVAGLL